MITVVIDARMPVMFINIGIYYSWVERFNVLGSRLKSSKVILSIISKKTERSDSTLRHSIFQSFFFD